MLSKASSLCQHISRRADTLRSSARSNQLKSFTLWPTKKRIGPLYMLKRFLTPTNPKFMNPIAKRLLSGETVFTTYKECVEAGLVMCKNSFYDSLARLKKSGYIECHTDNIGLVAIKLTHIDTVNPLIIDTLSREEPIVILTEEEAEKATQEEIEFVKSSSEFCERFESGIRRVINDVRSAMEKRKVVHPILYLRKALRNFSNNFCKKAYQIRSEWNLHKQMQVERRKSRMSYSDKPSNRGVTRPQPKPFTEAFYTQEDRRRSVVRYENTIDEIWAKLGVKKPSSISRNEAVVMPSGFKPV